MKNAIRKLTCILLSAVLLFSMTACGKSSKPRNYENTKSETLEFFYDKKEEFLSVIAEIEADGPPEHLYQADDDGSSARTFEIKGIKSIFQVKYDLGKRVEYICVRFWKGHNKFLGGAEWGLYYNSDNKPHCSGLQLDDFTAGPYAGSWYWRESPIEGNNFCAIERIEECWFFYYDDWDGDSHGLDWAKSSAE